MGTEFLRRVTMDGGNRHDAEENGREEAERSGRDKEYERSLVIAMIREAIARGEGQLPPRERPKGVHYTELSEMPPGEPLASEWNTYVREIGGWLAEGREGQHVLIKGEEIIGFYATEGESYREGLRRYLGQPFFIHAIRTEEPYLRIRGVNMPWPTFLSRSHEPA
jgi:hypothetical protein